MSTAQQAEWITTPVGTAYFTHLTQPRTITRTLEDGTTYERSKYEVTLVYDEADDLSEIERIVRETATAAFGNDAEAALRDQGQLAIAQSEDDIASAWGPFRTTGPTSKYFPPGSRRIYLSHPALYDHWLLSEPSDAAPTVVGTALNKNGEPAVIPGADIYDGMRVRARVSAFPFGYEDTRGVMLELGNAIQKVAKREAS